MFHAALCLWIRTGTIIDDRFLQTSTQNEPNWNCRVVKIDLEHISRCPTLNLGSIWVIKHESNPFFLKLQTMFEKSGAHIVPINPTVSESFSWNRWSQELTERLSRFLTLNLGSIWVIKRDSNLTFSKVNTLFEKSGSHIVPRFCDTIFGCWLTF